MNDSDVFTYGSRWLRADFHLHTRADKEFVYSGKDNDYLSDYVQALKSARIHLGMITNHNKFDYDEYKELRRKALKESIFLLPGVELSVNDGANGVHVLIVFNDKQWFENGEDRISSFITSMFPGQAVSEYENKNGRSDKNIIQLVDELDKTSNDYFLIFAHVEQKNGLWYEMSGGKLGDFSQKRYEKVRQRTLGFQKVKTIDNKDKISRSKVQSWFGDWYPAEVEGSDCKSIEDIGRGKASYIKIGASSFDALKFALTDHKSRVSHEIKKYTNSHIKSIRFEGGTLDGEKIYFSQGMNTLIGIRGSGKSSILEVLRNALEIPVGEKAGDQKYKEDLVGYTMGSGGKVVIDAVDRYSQAYEIKRIWGQESSEVFRENKFCPGVSIRETVIHKPIYFGQKDLSNTGDGFEKDLVEKLLGEKLDTIRREIDQQKSIVLGAVDRLIKIEDIDESIREQTALKKDTEHRLEFYKKHGVEEKLQKRLDFDNDIRTMEEGVGLGKGLVESLRELLERHEDDIRNFIGYKSKHNPGLIEEFYTDYNALVEIIETLKNKLSEAEATTGKLSRRRVQLGEIRKNLVEEFAGIERKFAEQLKNEGEQNISSGEFLELTKKLVTAENLLNEFCRQRNKKKEYEETLTRELQKLNELWHEEFKITKQELDQVGKKHTSISISTGYKEDKQAFLTFMKELIKGSGMREATYSRLVDAYQDFIAIYQDMDNAQKLFGSNPQVITDLFQKNLKAILTFQTPNKFTIRYRDKELQHHSLGQRASALILFVLSQGENDIIIIDQPEDDLDNQTIYEDVIKLIRSMKPKVQFIFATHNPNIPVLGDAELVHACSFADDKVSVESGSIDKADIQATIVNIMEGGHEAFKRRKEIYQIWKP